MNRLTAEKLRKSILQLAIQGKLVKQDPNDEPTSELVKKIYAEKQKLIADGKIKKEKEESFIFKGDDNHYYEKKGKETVDITADLPFDIPDTWTWVRHNSLFEISGGSQPPKTNFSTTEKPGFIRLYQIRDYGENPVPVYIPLKKAQKQTKKGDILLARYGASVGKVFWAEDGAYNVAMAKVIKLFSTDNVSSQYLFYYYKSSLYQELVKNNSRSAQAGFNKEDLNSLFLPLPPLAEQERIVEKINSLEPMLEKYDELEKNLNKLESEFKDKLKKSILQYAIQGKLVEQDPNDEPVEKLMDDIKTEKEKLIKSGKIKRDKSESYIYHDDDKNFYEKINGKVVNITADLPFDIPDTWTWVRQKFVCWLNNGEKYKGIKLPYLEAKVIRGIKAPTYLNEGIIIEKGESVILVDGENSGEIMKAPYKGFLGSTFKIFSAVNNINMNYLMMFFKFYKELYKNSKVGAAIPHLNKNVFKDNFLPLPPLAEQHRIVEKIEELFKIIG